jgi:hypothetical protein
MRGSAPLPDCGGQLEAQLDQGLLRFAQVEELGDGLNIRHPQMRERLTALRR